MKYSVTSYSFKQYIDAGKMTQLDCVAKAKELGFDGIEFTPLDGANLEEQKEQARKIRAEADRVGIEIVSYTIGACLYRDTEEECDAEVERLKGQLDVAKILGVKLMRHDVCSKLGTSGNSRSFDLMLPTIVKTARRVTEYAASLGIKTCSENHGYVAQDSERVERLFNAVAHENYGLLVDLGNFLCADENPESAVSRVAPYAIHVHAKDFVIKDAPIAGRRTIRTRGGNHLLATAVGEGNVPVKKCLKILKLAGYDGYVTVEYEGVEDCIAAVGRGLNTLKGFVAELDV